MTITNTSRPETYMADSGSTQIPADTGPIRSIGDIGTQQKARTAYQKGINSLQLAQQEEKSEAKKDDLAHAHNKMGRGEALTINEVVALAKEFLEQKFPLPKNYWEYAKVSRGMTEDEYDDFSDAVGALAADPDSLFGFIERQYFNAKKRLSFTKEDGGALQAVENEVRSLDITMTTIDLGPDTVDPDFE